MKKLAKTATVSLVALLALSLTSVPLAFESSPEGTRTIASAVPSAPCSDDDSASVNCFWDATRQGNGEGHSYWVDEAGNVTYLDPSLNQEAEGAAWARENELAGREDWGTYDGHRLCYAEVGDTSCVYCFDGYETTT